MSNTYWDIKPHPRSSWTTADWDTHRFFKKLGVKVKATVYDGHALVLVYNAKKPSHSIIIKEKM